MPFPSKRFLVALVGAVLVACGGGASAAPLPGGASSLNETYQDWRVDCQAQQGAARCAMAQIQTDSRSGRRVLAIELRAPAGKGAAGTLLMPFGLALSPGVTLKVDEGAPTPSLAFATCLPSGCLVPLDLDAAMLADLKAGRELAVAATAHDSGQTVLFTVSLKGFSAALARLSELTR